jgi:hypothetical protein
MATGTVQHHQQWGGLARGVGGGHVEIAVPASNSSSALICTVLTQRLCSRAGYYIQCMCIVDNKARHSEGALILSSEKEAVLSNAVAKYVLS